jgi:hypothetical protein
LWHPMQINLQIWYSLNISTLIKSLMNNFITYLGHFINNFIICKCFKYVISSIVTKPKQSFLIAC